MESVLSDDFLLHFLSVGACILRQSIQSFLFETKSFSFAPRGSFVLGHLNMQQKETARQSISISFIYYFALNDVANNRQYMFLTCY